MAELISGPRVDRIEGLWAWTRSRYEAEVQRGDSRAFELPAGLAPAFNSMEGSTAAGARRALESMDAGQPQEVPMPARHRFPDMRDIAWLADRSTGVIRLWVHPDDRVEPAAFRTDEN